MQVKLHYYGSRYDRGPLAECVVEARLTPRQVVIESDAEVTQLKANGSIRLCATKSRPLRFDRITGVEIPWRRGAGWKLSSESKEAAARGETTA